MSLATVPITPNMTFDQLANALNQNFALLENLNRTQIFKDDSGTNRIILGRQPDGTYGLVISKPGQDVVKLYSS